MTNTPAHLHNTIVEQIKELVTATRNKVAKHINNEAIIMNWHIGKMIVDFEKTQVLNENSARAFILQLSKMLTNELGKGFSRSSLFNMRKIFLMYPDVQTLSGHRGRTIVSYVVFLTVLQEVFTKKKLLIQTGM